MSVKFVIETHSEAFVNKLGELIADKKVLAEDVQVLLFEEDPEDRTQTSVRVSNFNKDGALINWPYGFFQPEV